MLSVFRALLHSDIGGNVSYLADQKTRIMALVDGLQEEVSKVESADDADEIFRAWKSDLWRLVEDIAKTSFSNGKLATRTTAGGSEPNQKRAFAWKRGKDGQ